MSDMTDNNGYKILEMLLMEWTLDIRNFNDTVTKIRKLERIEILHYYCLLFNFSFLSMFSFKILSVMLMNTVLR